MQPRYEHWWTRADISRPTQMVVCRRNDCQLFDMATLAPDNQGSLDVGA
jgi:hypothetical protein